MEQDRGRSPSRRPAAGRDEPGRAVVLIEVRPLQVGWRVSVPSEFEAVVFFSGRRAEHEARRMTLTFAATGHDARLHIHDRAQTLVGAYLCSAASGVLSPYLSPENGCGFANAESRIRPTPHTS